MPSSHASENLVCPECRHRLERVESALLCTQCDRRYPLADGIADFSEGSYYDHFDGDESELSEHQQCGLHHEQTGVEERIREFYLPLIRAHGRKAGREPLAVLDSGCGNGVSVEILSSLGVEAWGNDFSALRKWQWKSSPARERLVVADTRKLPFPDGFFDVVLSSGVLEHVGVDEVGGEEYRVSPRPDRDEARLRFLRELTRVTRDDGVIYLDFPNGAFPIDFWHGPVPGGARFHSLSEGFLPKVGELRGYLRSLGRYRLKASSPRKRLRMKQVGRHWWGRVLRWPVRLFLFLMDLPGLSMLAASPFNPYLVLKIEKR